MKASRPERHSDAVLRRHFPALYITLVSIVIALAVEGLLARLQELRIPEAHLDRAVLGVQIAQFVGMASIFWWVAARWVTSVPWPFGVFDGLSMIVMLVMLHFIGEAIGGSFHTWLLAIGVFTLSAAFVYRWNGYRGIVHTDRSERVARAHRIPSLMLLAIGAGLLSVMGWFRGAEPTATAQLVVLLFTVGSMSAFAYADYRIWKLASDEPGRFVDEA